MKSKCCNEELVQKISGWIVGPIGFTNTEYICSKCKKKYDPEDV